MITCRHRRRRSGCYLPDSSFWDNLSKVSLSKLALRELRRQTRKDHPELPLRPSDSATNLLRQLRPQCVRELRRFARSGGPDNTDIRSYPLPQNFREYSLEPPTFTEVDGAEAEEGSEYSIPSRYMGTSAETFSDDEPESRLTFAQVDGSSGDSLSSTDMENTSITTLSEASHEIPSTGRYAEEGSNDSVSPAAKTTSVETRERSSRKTPRKDILHRTIHKAIKKSSGHHQRAQTSVDDNIRKLLCKISKRNKNITAYDANFERHLIENGVYSIGFREPGGRRPAPPQNLNDIKRRLPRSRPSLAPSRVNSIYEEFEEASDRVCCEQEVMDSILPLIEGKEDRGSAFTHRRSGGQVFNNLAPLTKAKLVKPKPDRFYGSHAHLLHREIRDELSDTIVPSKQKHLTILPNFSVEVKGPRGTSEVAKRQACYNGALGSRAIHSLRSYREVGKSTPYDDNAYTISSTFESGTGTLTMYASHPRKSSDPSRSGEYVMTRIGAWCLNNSPETFQEGVAAYRNARDWAQEQREEAIRQANAKVSGESISQGADTSSA